MTGEKSNSDRVVPSYELSQSDLNYLTDKLFDEYGEIARGDHRFIVIEANPKSRVTNIARHIERVVFEESFGNDAQEMIDEYGPYEESSRFFVALDLETRQAVGALRVIENGVAGLKTINDVVIDDQDPEKEHFGITLQDVIAAHEGVDDMDNTWDIGTAAVLKESRRKEGESVVASLLLYRALYKAARLNKIDHFVSVMDHKIFKNMTGLLALNFVHLAGAAPRSYLGSNSSHAVYGHTATLLDRLNIRIDSGEYPRIEDMLRVINGTLADDAVLLRDP